MIRIKIELLMLLRMFMYPLVSIFRTRARHVVYNYELEHDIFNYLLLKNKPIIYKNSHEITGKVNYLIYENIPKWKYLLYKWLVWIYLDDNCDVDTYYLKDLSNICELYPNSGKIEIPIDIVVGSSWKLGDARMTHPSRNKLLEWLVVNDYRRMNYYYTVIYTTTRSLYSEFVDTVYYNSKVLDVYKLKDT